MLPQRRKIPSSDLAFSAGTTVSQPLPRGFLVEGWDFYLSGNVVVSGGTTSGTAKAAALQTNLIRSVKLIANGSRTLQHWTGQQLRQWAQFMRGAFPAQTALSGTLGAATYPFAQFYHIPARVLRAAVAPGGRASAMGFKTLEEMTSLPAYSYKELTLEVEYGDATDFYTGGDRTYAFSATAVELYERYAATESLTASQRQASAYATTVREQRTFTVTAAQDDFEMELPKAVGKDIARILIRCVSDGALSDGILSSLSIKGDDTVDIISEMSWAAARAFAKETYALETALETGWLIIDFAEDQNLADILPTSPRWDKLHIKGTVLHPGTTDQIFVMIESVQA